MSQHVLTLKEAADYLKVHPSTIYRLAKKRKLPAFHVGRDWRFSVEAIDNWSNGQERSGISNGTGTAEVILPAK